MYILALKLPFYNHETFVFSKLYNAEFTFTSQKTRLRWCTATLSLHYLFCQRYFFKRFINISNNSVLLYGISSNRSPLLCHGSSSSSRFLFGMVSSFRMAAIIRSVCPAAFSGANSSYEIYLKIFLRPLLAPAVYITLYFIVQIPVSFLLQLHLLNILCQL